MSAKAGLHLTTQRIEDETLLGTQGLDDGANQMRRLFFARRQPHYLADYRYFAYWTARLSSCPEVQPLRGEPEPPPGLSLPQ